MSISEATRAKRLDNRARDVERRFWASIELAPRATECWLWTGYRGPLGYGRLRDGARHLQAHRFAYELLVGPIPAGLDIDHLCRVRACVNPVHLEPVTRRENVLRGVGRTAANARKTLCIHGHDDWRNRTGGRGCRTCNTEEARRKRERQREATA